MNSTLNMIRMMTENTLLLLHYDTILQHEQINIMLFNNLIHSAEVISDNS